MRTVFFYFSATGNTLYTVKEIARHLTAVEQVAISSVVERGEGYDCSHADRIGIFFPVYAWGPPRIVMDFLKLQDFHRDTFVFSFVTCTGIPGNTHGNVARVLKKKGITLKAGFTVKAPAYTLDPTAPLAPPIKLAFRLAGKERTAIKTFSERCAEIVKKINQSEESDLENSNILMRFYSNRLHDAVIKTFKSADNVFTTTTDCNSCGQCAKICPRGNISLKEGKPVWNGNCENCGACIQWCPHTAIRNIKLSKNVQGHHPGVIWSEIGLQS